MAYHAGPDELGGPASRRRQTSRGTRGSPNPIRFCKASRSAASGEKREESRALTNAPHGAQKRSLLMPSIKSLLCVHAILAATSVQARAGSDVILDQIGPAPGLLAGSASSSQFNPANPAGVFATADNFTVPALGGPSGPVHLTRFE